MAVAVLVVVAFTASDVGLRFGADTGIPKKVPAAAMDVFVAVNTDVLAICTVATVPVELTVDTGVALIKVWKNVLESKPLLVAILASIAPVISVGTGLLAEGGVGTEKRLMLAGKPKANSVREAPSFKVAAETVAGATYALVPKAAVSMPLSFAAIVVKGVTPTVAAAVTDGAAVAKEMAAPLTLRPDASS